MATTEANIGNLFCGVCENGVNGYQYAVQLVNDADALKGPVLQLGVLAWGGRGTQGADPPGAGTYANVSLTISAAFTNSTGTDWGTIGGIRVAYKAGSAPVMGTDPDATFVFTGGATYPMPDNYKITVTTLTMEIR